MYIHVSNVTCRCTLSSTIAIAIANGLQTKVCIHRRETAQRYVQPSRTCMGC